MLLIRFNMISESTNLSKEQDKFNIEFNVPKISEKENKVNSRE